jgi:excisionase family DNA binding protein
MLAKRSKLLRVPQAAEYLNGIVSEKTLRSWIFLKKIDVVRIGGAVCIPVEALDKMIEHVPAVPRPCRTSRSGGEA